MSINLSKGQKINLRKESGEKLEKFCVEVSWGAIETVKKGFFGGTKKIIEDVDLDLSCVMLDGRGEVKDHLYSPEYNGFLRKNNLPLGKLVSKDNAMRHSGDDLGNTRGADFKEVISVDMTRIDKDVDKIFFFLNIYLNQGQNFDFSHIPFAKIKMYEGTPTRVEKDHMAFDVVTDSSYAGQRAVIMGKLYRRNGDWKFDAIGEATDDTLFLHTLDRIVKKYN